MSTITDPDAIAIAEALAEQINIHPMFREFTMNVASRIADKFALNPNWFHDRIIAALK